MTKRIIFMAFLIFIIACTPTIPNKKYCTINSDCVPSACCHANDSVNKVMAPNCKMVSCSEECAPLTIDCSQGEIKCVNNECRTMIH